MEPNNIINFFNIFKETPESNLNQKNNEVPEASDAHLAEEGKANTELLDTIIVADENTSETPETPSTQEADTPAVSVNESEVIEEMSETVSEEKAPEVKSTDNMDSHLLFEMMRNEMKQQNEETLHAIYRMLNDTRENINLINELRSINHTTIEELRSLKSSLKEKGEILDKQEETIKRQSQTISKFQDDLLYKIQKPLIMEMIEFADNVRLILNDQEINEHKDFDALMERVKGLADWVDASLSNNSVRRYSLTEEYPDTIDMKKQVVIDIENTDDPAKDSTYFTERPGYIWSMPYLIINSDIQLKKALEDAPKSFEFIIRPEEIVKYKYTKPEKN